MLELVRYKIMSVCVKTLVFKSYSLLLWIVTSVLLLYLLTTNHYIITFEVTEFLYFVSIVLLGITGLDRIIHKKLTNYVLVNRIANTIHMSSDFKIKESRELRREIDNIIEDFVKNGIPILKRNKTYTLKTHEFILKKLLKYENQLNLQVEPIGEGVVKEKLALVPFKAIFSAKMRRLHFLKKEKKYKVTIRL